MHDALREPFSVRVLEGSRLLTALYAACQTNDNARCAEAWAPVEPWTPWESQSLAARRDTYRLVRDPRREAARKDADEILACGASKSWLRCF